MLPKIKGIAFFTSCAEGAREAAKELGNVELVYDGPTDGDPSKAAELVSQWALQGFDVIAVSADDPQILGSAMKKAQAKGVKCIAWDADTPSESRAFFVNQATPEQIGYKLVDVLADEIGGQGEMAIVSSSQTSSNQNNWIAHMKTRLEKYPEMKLVTIEYPGEDQDRALETTRTLLKAYPNLKGVWGLSSVSFPGAAEAIRQAGKGGQVRVTGVSTPAPMRSYVDDGTVQSIVLWDTRDLGYLTVYTAEAIATGKLKRGDTTLRAGRLGGRAVVGDNVLLGEIIVFNKNNIDRYDF
ncbi:MAG: substrate-binding domain-containing protein [Pirellulales bacterium]|nr:substrate-binding domain-containing protein [Pirellulales bacterium]